MVRPWVATGVGLVFWAVLAAGCGGGSQPAAQPSKPKAASTSSTVPSSIPPTTTATTVAPTTTSTLEPTTLLTVTIGGWTGTEPDIIYFSGDSGNIVNNISWTSWNVDSALGHGTWSYDDCVPDCAQGTVTEYPATLMLSNPSGGQFTSLTEVQTGSHGNTYTFTLPDRDLGGAS